jgi:hypothetical protein
MNNVDPKNGHLPHAHIDDLDLSNPVDFEMWRSRMMAVARFRLDVQRDRLVRAKVITPQGESRSNDLPPDMRPDSQTSTDT